jgi:hypothetical protein
MGLETLMHAADLLRDSLVVCAFFAATLGFAMPSGAQENADHGELAKKLANPVASLKATD